MITSAPLPDADLSLKLPEVSERNKEALCRVVAVVAALRHPEKGCPWDLKQTHQSLRPYMLEEAYEAAAAMNEAQQKPQALREELGDVLLQVLLHSQIASDCETFSIADVANALADKLIRRHPHVFASASQGQSIDSPEQVTRQWEAIKAEEGAKERSTNSQPSILEKVGRYEQPALKRAQQVSTKAVKVGFAWPDFEALWACVTSEYDELQEAVNEKADKQRLEDELGDCLFATVNLARELGIDAEVALSRATDKFVKRFQHMEQAVDRPLESLDFETWDSLWKQAKEATGTSL